MIYEHMVQRSPEWFAARQGKVTASKFADILTSTGKPSTKQEGYINDLVAEYMAIEPLEYYSNDAMQRGTDLEPVARRWYQTANQWTVQEVAFITNEALGIGCSPDGLIVDGDPGFSAIALQDIVGGLEIKCPGHRNHVAWMRAGRCPAEYYPQVQGTMLICEVDWWDFLSFHPQMERQLQVRVSRDDKWISTFEAEIARFHEKLKQAKEEAQLYGI